MKSPSNRRRTMPIDKLQQRVSNSLLVYVSMGLRKTQKLHEKYFFHPSNFFAFNAETDFTRNILASDGHSSEKHKKNSQ